MFEVVFRVAYDSFYCDISRRYPSFRMFFWCNGDYDIIEIVVENQDEFKLVMDELKEHKPGGIIEESSDQQKVHLYVKRCSCDEGNSVSLHTENLHILHILPSIVENGWEHHRVVIFQHKDFEELLERLVLNRFTVDILRKVPYDGLISSSLTLTADTLLSGLTRRQINALLTAHKYGYYKLPRRTDVQTIAVKEQVARTTFQEHLKKAENKLVEALVPYITMFKHTTLDQRKKLKIV